MKNTNEARIMASDLRGETGESYAVALLTKGGWAPVSFRGLNNVENAGLDSTFLGNNWETECDRYGLNKNTMEAYSKFGKIERVIMRRA